MTTTPRTPEPPAEGELIRVARLARGLSAEDAAALAQVKLGAARWRQIERGYKTRDEPVHAPPKTLAHMARVVGVTPEQLEGAGRGDAAEILREILRTTNSSTPEARPALSPDEELFRRVVTAAAKELRVRPDASDEIMRRVRRDLEEAQQPVEAPERDLAELKPEVLHPAAGRTDLSDLVSVHRAEAGLSLQEVAARTLDPTSGEHVIEADWLDRLEQAALDPAEHPQYPQLDALADALGLDPGDVQEAAGVQFMDVHTVWSEDGQVRAVVTGELSSVDLAKVQNLMRLYGRAPKR